MVAAVLMRRRAHASLCWALVALAASACLTPMDPGAGDVAELKVRASFAPGADPDAVGVTVDSAAVVAAPSDGEPATVDTIVAVSDLDSALSWIVDLGTDSADYTVHLALLGQGQMLYQGDDGVVLHRLPLGDAPIFDIPVAYVGPGAITEVIVTPGAATLTATGAQQSFAAEARDADGKVVGAAFTWTTSDEAVATVDPTTGVATAVATGAATITAAAQGVSGTADLTVALGGLVVEIAPASAIIPALNATKQFTASAHDANGTPVTNARFSWATGDAAIATVDDTGLVTAVAEGSTTVRAETGGVADTADVLVAVAATVDVAPASATLSALGATQQFSAVARKANGDTIPGVTFAWTSSAPDVAPVDSASGLATAAGNGTTTITATAGDASGTASLTVDQAIVSIEVTPTSATLTTLGATQQFTAVARDANDNPVSTTFAWTSSAPSVATVDGTSGLATAVATGQTTITATAGSLSASAQLIVSPGGLVVDVSPDSATLTAIGATRRFTATATDGNGDPVTDATFTWITRDSSIVSVDSTGLATAVGEGNAWIVAKLGDAVDSARILVAVATTVEVMPATATLAAFEATQQFVATARDGAGAIIPGATFTWSSGDPAIATVDAALGVATAVSNGTTTVTAQTGNASGNASVTVLQAVASIDVTPSASTLTTLDQTVQLTAAARDANDYRVTRPVTFAWSSDQTDVATVDASTGLVTATGAGTATITAAAEGQTGTASVTVDLAGYATWATITADPAGVEANNDDPSIITVRLFDENGDPLGTSGGTVALTTTLGTLTSVTDLGDGTYRASLRSGTSGFAVVSGTLDGAPIADTAGVRFSTAADRATITADPTEVVANSDIPSVITVQLFNPDGTPRTSSGGTVALFTNVGTLSAVTDLGDGSYQANLWSTVADTAVVTGTLNGIAIADSAQVVFTPPASSVTTIEVSPDSATLTALGAVQQFTAVAKDVNGNVVPGITFIWISSDSTIATVDSTGLATAIANGHVLITAQSGSVTGSATLAVCAVTSTTTTGTSAPPPVCQ
jgi:uncharacterized protein YjdB